MFSTENGLFSITVSLKKYIAKFMQKRRGWKSIEQSLSKIMSCIKKHFRLKSYIFFNYNFIEELLKKLCEQINWAKNSDFRVAAQVLVIFPQIFIYLSRFCGVLLGWVGLDLVSSFHSGLAISFFLFFFFLIKKLNHP